MAKPTPWEDEYTLLCERCGYVLEGLDQAGVCPECGKPITESLPCDRPGTLWQQKPSPWSLLRTWFRVLRHPKQSFDQMNCIEQDGIALTCFGMLNSLAAVFVLVLAITIFSALDEIGYVFLLGFFEVFYWLIGFLYAWIAVARIKFAARIKGYRVDSNAAWSIVGLASIGLCFGPISVLIGTAILLVFSEDPPLLGSFVAFFILFSIPVGLAVFEVLCSIGLGRCKYRNRGREEELTIDPPGALPNEPRP
jgi:hypothetical protein